MTNRPDVRREINRLVTRFMVERDAAGWSNWHLGKAGGFNYTVLDKVCSGRTEAPTLGLLIRAGLPMNMRLDWVPEHLRPLLELDEFEVRALVDAAREQWGGDASNQDPVALNRALWKLGRLG